MGKSKSERNNELLEKYFKGGDRSWKRTRRFTPYFFIQ